MSAGPAASADDLYQAFEELFAAQRRLRGRDARMVDGISLAQSRLLLMLARRGAVPLGQFAASVGISAASATQLADGLESRGLVQRTRSENDRRVITVDLTEAGRRRATESRERHRRLFETAVSDLPTADMIVGIDVLRRCAAYLDAL